MHKLILTLLTTSLLAVAADPFAGVWKPTQLDQWKTSPGMPERNKSTVLTFSTKGKDTVHVIYKDATAVRFEMDWVLNGEEKPDSTGNGKFSAKRINANHLQTLTTTAKGSVTAKYVVSADGKTLTWSRKGTGTSSGRAVDEVYLYAKLP